MEVILLQVKLWEEIEQMFNIHNEMFVIWYNETLNEYALIDSESYNVIANANNEDEIFIKAVKMGFHF